MSVILVHFIQWLEETFLKYLEDWEKSVDARVGFSKAEKNKMMLSAETRLGLKFTGIIIEYNYNIIYKYHLTCSAYNYIL